MQDSRTPPSPGRGFETYSLDRVNAEYAGQWILLKVRSFDETHTPSHGYVLAHGSEKRVRQALAALLADRNKAKGPYYLFSAYPRVRSGSALQAAINDAATQGDTGAKRPR